MTLTTGTRLPDATLMTMGENGRPVTISLSDKLRGRKVVIFALPGAFTGTCSTAHFPSFVRTADRIREKGVDEIMCLSVNDPFTLDTWGRQLGGPDAGITMLADWDGSFTREVGQMFSAPPAGLHNRSKRYAIIVEDGTVTHVGEEVERGCDISSGERILETL